MQSHCTPSAKTSHRRCSLRVFGEYFSNLCDKFLKPAERLHLYLFAGEKACFEFVGLKEEAVLDEEDAESEEESDELDFSMM